MKTLTIRGIDAVLSQKIKEKARESGTSINNLALTILRDAFGLGNSVEFPLYTDLDFLAGTWSEEDASLFLEVTKDCDRIDEEIWR